MKKITSLVVALIVTTTLSVSFASANLYDDKENIESEIEKQEEKVNEIEQKEAEVQSSIVDVVNKKMELMDRIDKTKKDIEKKQAELKKIQLELKKAIKKIKKQEADFASRVKADYEKRNQTKLEVFLKSDGISDFMNRLDFAKVIAKQDKEMLDSYKAEKEKVKKLQETEKKNLKALNTLKENQINDKAELVAVEEELKARAAELEAEKQRQQKNISTKKAELDSIAEKIRLNEKKEEGSKIDTSDERPSVASGNYLWPIAGDSWITDYFGMRESHPLYGDRRMHDGLDIGANWGTPIVSIQNGVVIDVARDFDSDCGYGGKVVISHGNGVTSLYAHASAIYVNVGDTVTAGEKIAAVGSSGGSDGPHLHLGITQNGVWADPLNYVSY